MAQVQCEVCGNSYDKPLIILVNGNERYFDSFECAIHRLAPVCGHCQCRVIGHGVEANGVTYCCAHCAHHEGAERIRDNESHNSPLK